MRVRIRRNPRRDYTETQKADMRRADVMTVRARIFELGVSKYLEDDCGLDEAATQLSAEILAAAADQRREAEEIYTRIRRETAATEHSEETETKLSA